MMEKSHGSYTLRYTCILFLFHCFPLNICVRLKTLNTRLGIIQGLEIHHVDGTSVCQYRGIPYAEPPIGNRRLEMPLKLRRDFKLEPLNATEYPPSCLQQMTPDKVSQLPTSKMSEDCLYLNIYAPCNESEKMAVMIWIHGGRFMEGQGSLYDGSSLAVTGKLIVVTINYRLGLLGFLSYHRYLIGNLGLVDQRMAMEWVKDNIAEFGGDPDAVTLFGEREGACSAGLHALNPKNVGLFHRIILESGDPQSVLCVRNSSSNLQFLESKLNCSSNQWQSYINCVKQKSVDEILAITESLSTMEWKDVHLHEILGPTVDGGYLIERSPTELLNDATSSASQFFRSLDIMVGVSESIIDTFLFHLAKMKNHTFSKVKGDIEFDALCKGIAPVISKDYFRGLSAISNEICDTYRYFFDTYAKSNEEKILELIRDFLYLTPAIKSLNIHSQKPLAGTYLYVFEQRNDKNSPQQDKNFERPFISEISSLIFGIKEKGMLHATNKTDNDSITSADLITYFGNFAKSGNPNMLNLFEWPKYDSNGSYIMLRSKTSSKTSKLFENRTRFWNEKIPNITNPVVKTSSGSILGLSIEYNETVFQFRGIPFAEPPIGNLRFRKTEPIKSWDFIFDGTRFPPSCMQSGIGGYVNLLLDNTYQSEDCLYLNIYVPRKLHRSEKRSVMIWVHGGSFRSGQGSLYDGSYLSLIGNVIIVTINYRLGIFGFLTTGTPELPGNYGLWDQQMAFIWTKNNIEYFGGNPESITLIGHSAGAISVGIHALSPLNKNLFRRVILQSGTSHTTALVSKFPNNFSVALANHIGCNSNTSLLISCLSDFSSKTLVRVWQKIEYIVAKVAGWPFVTKPIVDGSFIRDDPQKLLRDNSSESYKFFKSLDIVIGTVDGEGWALIDTVRNISNINVNAGLSSTFVCDEIVPRITSHINYPDQCLCDRFKVRNGDTSNKIEQAQAVANASGDMTLVSTAVEVLKMHSADNEHSNTYHFLFTHFPDNPLVKSLLFGDYPSWLQGTPHSADMFYVIGFMFYSKLSFFRLEPVDYALSKQMMAYWSNFAKTGDPNDGNSPDWPKFDIKDQQYIQIDKEISVRKRLWEKRLKFWLDGPEISCDNTFSATVNQTETRVTSSASSIEILLNSTTMDQTKSKSTRLTAANSTTLSYLSEITNFTTQINTIKKTTYETTETATMISIASTIKTNSVLIFSIILLLHLELYFNMI